ncbi:alpha-mannosidase [Pseudonocardia acaciae]|uniref:alpha-mannosidase n=1 Tax=Pseudonocardia acaciae TaxID=551276 RepID=UPI00048D0484|nr:glycoside hydrolase family 38 C-terminal domain-containing protein [Pseudonocardia acaciae]
MHDDRKLIEQRISRVLDERVRPAVYSAFAPVEVAAWDVPGEPVPVSEALAASFEPFRVGEQWGPPWGTTWFRFTGAVPPEWAERAVELVLDLGFDQVNPGFQAEGLVYRADGTPVKGLNPFNAWVPVTGSDDVVLYVEAAANPVILDPRHPFRPTPLGDLRTAGREPLYRLAMAQLAVFDEEVWGLVADLEVLDQLMLALPVESGRRWEILRACDRAVDALDLADVPGTAKAARHELATVLAAPAHASAHLVSAVGHAHIDSAWLWPLRETVRKVARTAANVTALMDEHPELVYAMSSAQQFAWIRDHHPAVYARVKEHPGRFVPVGGMWVESDTNMPGGEAMARQFTHGKRFFAEEFGVETEEVWLPDSFGYSAALPQLVDLSGSRWFLTQKISWSQTNTFPHHTFWWEGIDGTRVFTHFPPVDTYNSELSGAELAHASARFAEKGRARRSLVPFGFGDGGGGPTREMLARAARLEDLEGSPRVAVEAPSEFFRKACEEYPDAPVWVGELYLEFHRGTYTSQARTKQGNRRSEHLLREAELWAATAAVRVGRPYPYERLDRIWKSVLLNQFHDILPGSSIAWVHREAERTYAALAGELEEIIGAAQRALAGEGERPVVFNAAPHQRDGVPAGGAAFQSETPPAAVTAVDDGFVLDNGLIRVTVDGRGLVVSLVDLDADREVIAPGAAANLLQLHPDLPNRWDAWDVDEFYRNTVTDLTEAAEVSAEAAGVRIIRTFYQSTVTQRLTLGAGARRLDIETEVDWHETEKFLKLAFPLDVHADRSASETQFGHVHRPTHRNTSWDAAKFEICAHRWIHLAEPGYGVALANDSTYGHDVTRSARDGGGITTTVRASLLRAPRFPDPETDHGVHRFRHALVVGAGVGDAVREGYFLNLPARTVHGANPVDPLISVDNPDVCVEATKLADDGSGDVIVRIYQATGARSTARITARFDATAAWTTDLLERRWHRTEDHPAADQVTVHLRPFEILTLRLTR